MTTTSPIPARPTAVGQRVRFVSYGGNVRMWMMEGTDAVVVGFTRQGNPIIEFTEWGMISKLGNGRHQVVDTYGCAALVDDDGHLIYGSQS